MQIVRNSEELTRALARCGARATLALVPTMGALHAGHLALVAEAKQRADQVAATIFVNPMQFGAGEDLGRYPRREDEDAAMLEEAGCDLLWLPSVGDIYPDGFATTVSVGGVSRAVGRRGAARAISTASRRSSPSCCSAVRPDVALFGEKDFQQLAVIRRMVADLGIRGRDRRRADGARGGRPRAVLAQRLSFGGRAARRRSRLPRALEAARAAILSGTPVAEVLRRSAKQSLRRRAVFRGSIMSRWSMPRRSSRSTHPQGEMRLIAAAVIGTTRLIDNLAV